MIPYIDLVSFYNSTTVPLDFSNKLTNMEILSAMQKSLNTIVDIVNNLELNANAYTDEQVAILNLKIDVLRSDMMDDMELLDETLRALISSSVNTLNLQLAQVQTDLTTYINNENADLLEYVNSQVEELRTEITQNVPYVRSPVTSQIVPIQTAINDIFNAYKTNCLTALEYDNLQLTASQYDAKQMTAYEFEMNSKDLAV